MNQIAPRTPKLNLRFKSNKKNTTNPDLRLKEREKKPRYETERKRKRRNKTQLALPPLPPPTITASSIRLHKIKQDQSHADQRRL